MDKSIATIERRQSVPAAMVAKASSLLKPFLACDAVRACPVPRGFWGEMYEDTPNPQRIAAMFEEAGMELLPPELLEAGPCIRKAVEEAPDRDTISMLVAYAIDSHPVTKPASVPIFVEMVAEMLVSAGHNRFVTAAACRELLRTTKFPLTPADFVQACESARRELAAALDHIEARKRIAALLLPAPTQSSPPEESRGGNHVDPRVC